MKSKVGEREYLDLRQTGGYRKAMMDFDDVIKPGFHSKDDGEIYVSFPMSGLKDDPSNGIQGSTLTLPGYRTPSSCCSAWPFANQLQV